jgi:hypothetical protein
MSPKLKDLKDTEEKEDYYRRNMGDGGSLDDGSMMSGSITTAGKEASASLSGYYSSTVMDAMESGGLQPGEFRPTKYSDFTLRREVDILQKEQGMMHRRETALEMAFLFVKPHAATPRVTSRILEILENFEVKVLSQGKVIASVMEHDNLFSRQYPELEDNTFNFDLNEILLSPQEQQTFKEHFNKDWYDALKQKKLLSAVQFQEVIHPYRDNHQAIGHMCMKSAQISGGKSCLKIRKGLYVHRIDEMPKRSKRKAPIWVVNGFAHALKEDFMDKKSIVNYFSVQFDSSQLTWPEFMEEVVGVAHPKDSHISSIRGCIYSTWEKFGLKYPPSVKDNVVHVSSSAIDALKERLLWMRGAVMYTDIFGSRLLSSKISSAKVKEVLGEVHTKEGQGRYIKAAYGKNSAECIELLQSK